MQPSSAHLVGKQVTWDEGRMSGRVIAVTPSGIAYILTPSGKREVSRVEGLEVREEKHERTDKDCGNDG